ncbi:FtsX-like permease family protein [Trueperella sp. HMSC08H06]|uniref:FtsX-like permease family protein n=1 Tax=Trueperella sp. HMSC08H06 TaxID=1581142 RepID=UPI0008A409A1|nr:FtsX-like permease family protein [Trueperella sp. HMSC08H06]OFS68807.1 hypothetical protein HMPREF3174_00440 [Trueperella sp. HMSC08H06]
MKLAAQLFKASAARSRGRLALLTWAVAFGVLILFLFSAYHHALFDRSYTVWRQGYDQARSAFWYDQELAPGDGDPLWMQLRLDSAYALGDHATSVMQVATDTGSPELPAGLPRWPEPGEYWVSPAVSDIMETSAYDVGMRFGSTKLGVLPESMVAGPDEQLVIMGVDKADIPDSVAVYRFNEPLVDLEFQVIGAVVYLGVAIVLFPVLILISIAAKLGSVQREQRYAALRLVGATNKQILMIVTFESLVAAAGGLVIGAAAYFAARPALFELTLGGGRQWPSRIDVTPLHWVAVALATIALIFLSNAWGMRGLRLSPLGVARRQKREARPGALRLLPLAAGIGAFVHIYATVDENQGNGNTVYQLMAAVIATMIGLVLAGPWFTYALGGLVRRLTSSADLFIGSSYVRAHASRVSRSVVGVVLALFAGSFFLTAVSDVPEDLFDQRSDGFAPGVVRVDGMNTAEVAQIRFSPWASEVHDYPQLAGAYMVMPCADAARFVDDVACDDGVVAINPYASGAQADYYGADVAEVARELEANAGAYIEYDGGQPVTSVVALVKLREAGDIEALRNVVAGRAQDIFIESATKSPDTTVRFFTQLTYAGIAVTLVVSVISLVVSTYSGLLERRRSLLSLRLCGMTLRQLGAMVLVESFVPLVVMSTIATAAGIGAGFVLMHAVSYTLDARFTGTYVAALIGALIAAGLAIVAILPSMKKMTRLAVNRTE